MQHKIYLYVLPELARPQLRAFNPLAAQRFPPLLAVESGEAPVKRAMPRRLGGFADGQCQ
jgi:hypothetical protein